MQKPLPQFVSSTACLPCDVCCRFPDGDSFLRPYFTRQEIAEAVAQGVRIESFPDLSGTQIDLVKNSTGEGYVCPAFNATTGQCGIYEVRPLDCRLYPLSLMWNEVRDEVLLGWDTKCPFMREAIPGAIVAYAERVADLLATEAMIAMLVENPGLIGRFQEDVVVLRPLPTLTAWLLPPRIDPRLRPLTWRDAPRFIQGLKQGGDFGPDTLAAYSFPYHYIWTSFLPHWWMESHETFFLFARSPDGWFMPLVPLGPRPLVEMVEEAFMLMRKWNALSPVTRVENAMGPQKQALEGTRFRCRQKDGDYLYRAEVLAALAGDHFKSQRALCNRVERDQVVLMEPYREVDHREGCLALHCRWAAQKQVGMLDSIEMLLLQDTKVAHSRVLAEHGQIGLSGMVAKVEGRIVAYTFGYWLTPYTWCILLEVADRTMTGLAQWLFRETCRTALSREAIYINAMEDASLPGLRAAKRAYHPLTIIDNWVITDLQA